MMVRALVVVLVTIPFGAAHSADVITIARAFVGHCETAPNRSPLIDSWNARVRAPLGSPWCAAFVSFVLDSARVRLPRVRSAAARAFITPQSIPIAFALSQGLLRRGWLIIWRRGSSGWQGHIGFLLSSDATYFRTIEGNTGARSDYDGDCVMVRLRSWRRHLVGAFRVTHVTPVQVQP